MTIFIKNRKTLISYINIFIVSTILIGCRSLDEKMYGKWGHSVFISNTDLKKASLEMESDIEATLEGECAYYRRQSYTCEGEIGIRLINVDKTIKFNIKEAGTWYLRKENGEIKMIETVTDQRTLPSNEFTKEIITESPEILETFRPVKGSSDEFKITFLSKNRIEIEYPDVPNKKFILQRIVNKPDTP